MATPLERLSDSLCFPVEEPAERSVPDPRLDESHRIRYRTLTKMQKEALVTSSRTGDTWRLASDEGPYLDGADIAPPPLAFLSVGMVSSFLTAFHEVADEAGEDLGDVRMVLDNRYGMSGSALRGTMAATAFPPELAVETDRGDDDRVFDLAETAVRRSPLFGFLSEKHRSRFNLVFNDDHLPLDEVASVDRPPHNDPRETFDRIDEPTDAADAGIVRHTGRTTEPYEDADDRYLEADDSTVTDEHDRIVHLQATARTAEDGTYDVVQRIYSPRASVFEYVVDDRSYEGRAPDALSYALAGIGFCFLTQLGRYAEVVGEDVGDYALVQDTHVAHGSADDPGVAVPVESDVFIDADVDESFARETVAMSEQTCYVHSLCRSAGLEPSVTVI